MQIQPIHSDKSVRFGSGLTKDIIRRELSVNPLQIENKFRHLPTRDWGPFSFYYIDLKDNKAVALASDLCAKIFVNFRKLADYRDGHSMQNLVSPQDIYVFNEKDSEGYKDADMFVNSDAQFFEKDKPIFYIGTVFINNKYNSLEHIDEKMEKAFNEHKLSSGHFLQPFIHEWIHAIEDKLLLHIASNNTKYHDMLSKINIPTLNSKESEIVADVLGTYASQQKTGQYLEVMAEAWSKFICDSLSEDCSKLIKNPVDLMKTTPKEFQKILRKVTDIKTINNNY